MNQKNKQKNYDLIGFSPLFFYISEAGRAILIAKRYQEKGGKVIFFSHGGEFEYFAKDFGFDIIKIKPYYSENFIDRYRCIARGEKKEQIYTESFLKEIVENDVKIYKKTGIKALVSTNNEPCKISAKLAKIPLIAITTGPGRFQYSIPDIYENSFIRFIPRFIKVPIFNWMLSRSKNNLAPFNSLLKKNNLTPINNSIELYYGDTTLITNHLEFLNIFPNQQQFPDEDYIGIILLEELFKKKYSEDQAKKINLKFIDHLKGAEKTILLSMGSSGNKELFINILNELNNTSYKVIAVYTNILNEDELPDLDKNILLIKYVPSLAKLHKMVDLSIIHGGQGTVYTAAYSGKPIIGYPLQFEQHLNLEKMVGHGAGIMLSRKFFKGKKLTNSIEHIFDNYDRFLRNAEILSKKLPEPNGDINAAEKIYKISSKIN